MKSHALLVAIVAVAALARAAAWKAYYPANFYADSWTYLDLAWGHGEVTFTPSRPSGYPFLIWLLGGGVPELSSRAGVVHALVAVQHFLGLAAGVLAYAVLRRLGVTWWIACAAAAVVLLDVRMIALEQQVLTESVFAFLLMVAVACLVLGRNSAPASAFAGALIGLGVTMRPSAVFALPVLLLYLSLVRAGWRARTLAVGLACLAALAPIGVHSFLRERETGRSGLTGAGGTFLYGRVAELGCYPETVPAETQVLCEPPGQPVWGPAFYLYAHNSPLNRYFGIKPSTVTPQQDAMLRRHALAVVRHRPLAYASLVAADVLRYFIPGYKTLTVENQSVRLPEGAVATGERPDELQELFSHHLRLDYDPELGAALSSYQSVARVPRPFWGLSLVAGLVGLGLAIFGSMRNRMRWWRETFVLTGAALSILIASTALSVSLLRYVVPLQTLAILGGLLAVLDLSALIRGRGASSAAGSAVDVEHQHLPVV